MLRLPNKNRISGLFLYCNKCKKHYSNDSFLIKNKDCNCWDNGTLVYKAKIHVPGTRHQVKCKVLNANNFHEALTEFLNFKTEIEKNNYQETEPIEVVCKPELVIDCMAFYIAYLRNEDVPSHKKKTRTEDHIKEVERYFKYFITAITKKKIDVTLLQISQINDSIVGILHEYLDEELHYKNKTYNKFMGLFRTFMSFNNEKYGYNLQNPFNKVSKQIGEMKIETITKKEFESLLSSIGPGNGISKLSTNEKKNVYKPWLKDAFKLGLFTGRRREEIVMIKFSDISLDGNEELSYIESNHFKINRAFNFNDESKRIVKIPINKRLKELLYELGYEKNKGKDIYILAPDETMKRETMMDLISKAFTHYYGQLGTGRKLQFKSLRKTYISSAYKMYGEKARIITRHSGIDVMQKHYIDSEMLREASDDFDVFN